MCCYGVGQEGVRGCEIGGGDGYQRPDGLGRWMRAFVLFLFVLCISLSEVKLLDLRCRVTAGKLRGRTGGGGVIFMGLGALVCDGGMLGWVLGGGRLGGDSSAGYCELVSLGLGGVSF